MLVTKHVCNLACLPVILKAKLWRVPEAEHAKTPSINFSKVLEGNVVGKVKENSQTSAKHGPEKPGIEVVLSLWKYGT